MTTEERDRLTGLLREAEQAYHELAIGQSVKVVVHQNGQRMEYTPATKTTLKTYIQELKAQLGEQASPARPMRAFF